jgi:hypothetical protein
MVTDRIVKADVYERRAIDALGLDNANKFRFVNKPFRTYDWLEDTYVITSDTLTAAGGSTATDTTTITVTTPKAYNVGDVILIDSEYIWVSAVNTSTGVLTVVRNHGGTQAAHTHSTTVTIVSSARLEGADSDDSPTTEVTSTTNCSQIFQREIQVSRDEKLFPLYGITDLEDYYIDKKMDELIMMLNRVPYHGQRQAGSSSHSSGRSAGGFETFISTNTTAAGSVDLTRDHIDDMLEDIYGYGGSPDALFCAPFQQRKINEIYDGFIRTERSERVGGNRIDWLESPIPGMIPLQIIVDRHCKTGTVYLVSRKYAGYITIDPFFYERLGKVGDAELGQVVGEYGFVVAFEKAHGYINGLTTS